jgi:serine protease Do
MKRAFWLGLAAGLLVFSLRAGAQKSLNDGLRQDIEAVRQKVYPALVNISVVARYYTGGRAQRAPAGGSGVIVSKDGYVLTNYHVAGNTTRIKCTLPSGEELEARVITHDPMTDLSVLKLDLAHRADPNAELPYAVLGDSDQAQVGEQVLAMGNPMMLASSMTLGVVSNTKRVFTNFTGNDLEEMDLEYGERTGLFTRWIQHDALILPGNSGGPLVNLKGEVIGINELGGGGVGFAIPSNIAAQVLKAAIQGGKVERGWLGITIQPVKRLGRSDGALVASVWPKSPAEKAGILPGDILLALDDRPVTVRFFEEVPLFYQQVAALPAGKTVPLKYLRRGETRTASASIAPMERFLGKEEEERDMGITYQEITEPMALFRRFPNNEGVLVTGVRAGFPFEAAKPSIQSGDVILEVSGKPVPNAEAFRKALAEADKEAFSVMFRRNQEVLLTIVRVEDEKPDNDGHELPKAWLGVKTQVMTPEVAKAMKLENVRGYRISEVFPYTEASAAGLQVNDVLTAVNKDKLSAFRPQDAEDLKRLIEDLPIGEKAELTLLRGGKPLKLTVKMEATPAATDQAKKARQKELEFAVREILRMDRIERRLGKDLKGVLVTEATEGGLASVAGLDADDIILSINGQPVEDIEAFKKVIQSVLDKKPKVVPIFVQRGHRTLFIFIEPELGKLAAPAP